ncbi:MAG: TlpA family protein disulfide reductase [Flavobacteriales bacterium]|nr:TlpA family protein disulfide reductase [Flavobacteriales bacterium]
MSILRTVFFSIPFLASISARAQVLLGSFERPLPATHVVLYGTTGSDHPTLDSVPINPDGSFEFTARAFPAGFYQLGINGDDRIDLVLDPNDPVVEVAFHGTPLQRNLNVLRSGDNQRMWAYKSVSRSGQDELKAIQDQRAAASPLDTALLHRLDRHESRTRTRMAHALDSLSAIAPEGQFARAVRLDRELEAVARSGSAAIRTAFDFADPWALRSNAYAKATVMYLQSTRFDFEFAYHRACDTLLREAAADTACWRYMRHQLVEIFSTYGPDEVAQYLVDQVVIGPGSLLPPEPELLRIAAVQLRLAMGAPAPDTLLYEPGSSRTTRLSAIWSGQAYTALFFYSSTCDHCHAQLPGLRELVAEQEPRHFKLIGIALDATEAEFRATIAEEGITWPCYSALLGWGEPAAKAFNVKATPSLFVVDRKGRIVAKPMDHQALRTFLVKASE